MLAASDSLSAAVGTVVDIPVDRKGSEMPYRSAKQRRFMHAKHPGIAKRWDKKYGGKIIPKKPTVRKRAR